MFYEVKQTARMSFFVSSTLNSAFCRSLKYLISNFDFVWTITQLEINKFESICQKKSRETYFLKLFRALCFASQASPTVFYRRHKILPFVTLCGGEPM